MEPKQTTGNALAGEAITILILIGAYYHKYGNLILEKLNNPFVIAILVIVLVFLLFNYYTIGHEIEKYMNQMKMKNSGINLEDKNKMISFPFVDFDIEKSLEGFYGNDNNQQKP